MQNQKKIYYHSLDIIRAVAAFLVVLQHTRNMLFVDYQEVVQPNIFWKMLYFANFGHQAVIIFFVLSGCVVGRSILVGIERGSWSWRNYAFDRMTRLWIVLLPALVYTALCDYFSISLAPPTSFVNLGNDFGHMVTEPLKNSLTWTSFAGNVMFVQTILVQPFGSNGPLWSLAYEFWYYLIFPLFYVAFAKSGAPLARLWFPIIGTILLIFVGWRIASLFLVWLMGVAAYMAHHSLNLGKVTRRVGMFSSSLLLLGFICLSRFGLARMVGGGYIMDIITGIAATMVVCFGLSVHPPVFLSRLGSFFSAFSFSLYVFHAPALTCLISLGLKLQTNADRLQPSLASAGVLLGVLGLLYIYAYVVFLLFENQTSRLRQQLKSKIV